jgi:hypothetical protein
MITLLDLARILEAAAAEARDIAAERSAERRDWIDQSSSVLGPRRHIQAVRRRLKEGLDGAGQSGRRFLLSEEALAEELARPRGEKPREDEAERLRVRLRMLQGSGLG